jgi:hypothetical protein
LTGNGSLGDAKPDDEAFRVFVFAVVRIASIG